MKIRGKEYNCKITLGATFVFEGLAEKAFEINNTFDLFIYFYSVLYASNGYSLNFDIKEFQQILDEDPMLLVEFKEILSKYAQMNKLLSLDGNDDKKKE